MVGPHQVLPGQLVETLGEAFRKPPAVDEDERAPVASDELQDPRVDGRPDAHPHLAPGDGAARLLLERQRLAEPAHVLDRHHDPEIQPLPGPGIDDGDGPVRAGAGEESPDRVERLLGGREADPLERRRLRAAQVLEPLQGERQVGAPLGAGDRVHLVDDHRLHSAQGLAGPRRQQEVERLRRGDEDLGRALRQRPPLIRGRVAGPRGDGDGPHGRAEAPSRQGDPGQRGPQVPLDVVGQGFERADVQDPHGGARGRRARGRGRSNEPIDAPQEGGQRLAAARGGVEEDVAAAGDRRPALHLGRRRRGEGVPEPRCDGRREARERVLGGRGRGWAGGRSGSAGHGRASIRREGQTDRLF